MKQQRSHQYAKQYQAIDQVIDKQQKKLAFTFNYILMAIICLFLAQLYCAFQFKRVQFFVYTTMLIDVVYPFVLKLKQKRYPWKFILLEGTMLPSLLYALWMLLYPQKTYVYYVPMLVGAVGKIFHQICLENQKDMQDIVDTLIKTQAKLEMMVLVYAIASYFIKFKFGWLRLLRVVLLVVVYRMKYFQHYGTQLAWSQIHFSIDRVSRKLLLREYYHQFYAKFSLMSNRFNFNQVLIL